MKIIRRLWRIRMREDYFFVLMTSFGEIIGQGTNGDFSSEFYSSSGDQYWLIAGNRNDATLESLVAQHGVVYGRKVIMEGINDLAFSREQVEGGCLFFDVPKPVAEELLSFVHL